jgi:alpha-beta hydrolase superfamily lysophospholipase
MGYTHTQGSFSGKGGVEIVYQTWTVDKPKAVVVLVHGVGEHSGRYTHIINTLDGKGISFYGLDHRGHGRSGGKKGHVDSFMDYIHDLKLFVNIVKETNRDVPVIMLGHSMGGAIACRYGLTYQDDLSALILSSAGLISGVDISSAKLAVARILSKIAPGITMSNGIDVRDISHDEDIIAAYVNDPLNHDRISARWGMEFLENGKICLERASELKLPLLLFHGCGDKMCKLEGSQIVYDRAESKDKTLEVFPDLYHESMNETPQERAKVLNVVAKWILAHIPAAKKAAVPERRLFRKKSVKKKAEVKSSAKAAPKAAAKKSAPRLLPKLHPKLQQKRGEENCCEKDRQKK